MAWIWIAAIAAAVVIFYLMITRGEPVENWLADYVYAHRGLHGGAVPENSMHAFEQAAQKGYGIELDIHLSRDGVPVVIHDDDLKRMTGIEKEVSDLPADALSRLSLAGSKEGIPLFEDVLNKIAGQVPLLVELKNRGRAGELEKKAWELLKGYCGQFAVQSFSPYSIAWFRKNAPGVLRGQLSSRFDDMKESLPGYQIFALKHLLTNFLARPNFISYEIDSLPKSVVSRLRKTKIPVLGWTVRSETQKKHAEKYCDTVIFENVNP